MAANEKISDVQFRYHGPSMGYGSHRLTAHVGGSDTSAGHLLWSGQGIRNIMVEPELQRRGIGTAMWNEGHRLASENARIPKPKHSPDRTNEGDAWARGVGGRLPRRRG